MDRFQHECRCASPALQDSASPSLVFFVLVYVLGRYFIQGGSLPGFPFLASTIAIFSGVQLFALGVIGEYLARMYFRTMDRPVYTIRSTTRS
jgi:undecaprenyl-phosphate 4-deoxy-4-formamido-L-arabinose transferase